jgi:hypothetical protein
MTTAPVHQATTRERLFAVRALLVTGTVLFVLAAFAAGGDMLGGITDLPWAFGAFAAWMLAKAVAAAWSRGAP